MQKNAVDIHVADPLAGRSDTQALLSPYNTPEFNSVNSPGEFINAHELDFATAAKPRFRTAAPTRRHPGGVPSFGDVHRGVSV